MKSILLLITLFSVLHLAAQEDIQVNKTKLALDSLMQPAFVVEIPQAKSNDAIKMWEDRLVPKNLFSAFKKLPKMEKDGKDRWYIEDIVVSEICPDTLNIFTQITSLKDRILFTALFKTPNGFIGNDNGAGELEQRASAYVRSHAVEVYKDAVQHELDDLEKELRKMEKDYTGYDKDNRKLDRKSSESESNLSVINAPNDDSTVMLSEDQREEKEKEIKKEEKALKKYSRKMDRNEGKQKKLAREIRKKEAEIKSVEEKLRNIK